MVSACEELRQQPKGLVLPLVTLLIEVSHLFECRHSGCIPSNIMDGLANVLMEPYPCLLLSVRILYWDETRGFAGVFPGLFLYVQFFQVPFFQGKWSHFYFVCAQTQITKWTLTTSTASKRCNVSFWGFYLLYTKSHSQDSSTTAWPVLI